ncbi:MAG: hypothetical protein EOM21_13035 [Gammaproteobacteria bacterium]|nr:hypothetical protein [Gammaproteobacteria bacterium]
MGLELYTPPELATLAVTVLGGIDLDPAADTFGPATVPAVTVFTEAEDGLSRPWHGRVWLFPPATGNRAAWVQKALHEYRSGRASAVLLYSPFDARSPWWPHLFAEAAVCLLTGPLHALGENGQPIPRTRQGALLAYLGPDRGRFKTACAPLGSVLVAL